MLRSRGGSARKRRKSRQSCHTVMGVAGVGATSSPRARRRRGRALPRLSSRGRGRGGDPRPSSAPAPPPPPRRSPRTRACCRCPDRGRRRREKRETGPPAARTPLAASGATSSSEFHGYVQYQNPWPESRSAPRDGEKSPHETGTNDSVSAQVEELERGETAIDPAGAREELLRTARFRDPSR